LKNFTYTKTKKKIGYIDNNKIKTNNITPIYEEHYNGISKSVTNKVPAYKLSHKNSNSNNKDFQLPTIYNKNFSLKKVMNK
jgi:hypothetical protein